MRLALLLALLKPISQTVEIPFCTQIDSTSSMQGLDESLLMQKCITVSCIKKKSHNAALFRQRSLFHKIFLENTYS